MRKIIFNFVVWTNHRIILLNKLNKIRNSFAHTLENEALENEINEFVRITILRLEKEKVPCPKDTKDLKTVLVHFCGAVYGELSLV